MTSTTASTVAPRVERVEDLSLRRMRTRIRGADEERFLRENPTRIDPSQCLDPDPRLDLDTQ